MGMALVWASRGLPPLIAGFGIKADGVSVPRAWVGISVPVSGVEMVPAKVESYLFRGALVGYYLPQVSVM